MKNAPLPISVAAVIGAGAIFTTFTSSPEARAQADLPAVLQEWEYRALRIPDRRSSGGLNRELSARESASEDTLNLLGEKGWELVAVRNDDSSEPVFYFKRRKA